MVEYCEYIYALWQITHHKAQEKTIYKPYNLFPFHILLTNVVSFESNCVWDIYVKANNSKDSRK